jgi:transposase
LTASAKVKHDKRDALILAHRLSANLLPDVWVLPPHVRQRRSLIVHRHHLTTQRRMAKNRLRGALFRFNLPDPPWPRLTSAPGGKPYPSIPSNLRGSSTIWTPSTTWHAKSRM